jgi:hypothetical protein
LPWGSNEDDEFAASAMLRLTSGNKLRSLTSFLASSVRRRSAVAAVEEVDMEKERKSRLKIRRDEECPILMDELCVVDRYYTRTYIISYAMTRNEEFKYMLQCHFHLLLCVKEKTAISPFFFGQTKRFYF